MILRQSAGRRGETRTDAHRLGLRARMTLLTGVLVALVAGGASTATYWAAVGAMTANVDNDLNIKADILLSLTDDGADEEAVRSEIASFKLHNPYVRASYSSSLQSAYVGDAIPVGGSFTRSDSGTEISVRTVGQERVLVKRYVEGESVALAQDVDPQHRLLGSLGSVLMVIHGLGFLLSWGVGEIVAAAGMRPITRLKRAVDGVRGTQDLKGIRVESEDELGQLSDALNEMMESLEDSRRRQARLVADAGHELKTPLTSMRTNIELLMMLRRTGQLEEMAPADREDLERDVLAQMEEMSSLIGDLVDLARDDNDPAELEPFRLDEVLDEAVERVRRRRPDVTFQYSMDPWEMMGDAAAMGRGPLNIIDNAAKWSPPGGTVRVSLKAATRKAVLIVDDSGPGIPPDERAHVFERFYRSPESRSMPGSGLGLAIAQQVIVRHGGQMHVEESDDGGARFRTVFPGWRPQEAGEDIVVIPPTSPDGVPRIVGRTP